MPLSPLTVAQLRAFAKDASAQRGRIVKMAWATKEDPNTVRTWRCKIHSVDTTVGSFKFTSEDADAEDVDTVWDFPAFDEPDEADTDGDTAVELEFYYYRLAFEAVEVKKKMSKQGIKTLGASDVIAWKKKTWIHKINQSSEARVTTQLEVFRQLNVPERMNQKNFTSAEEHEACFLGEILLSVIALIAATNPEVRDSPQMDAILDPILMRLSEFKHARGLTGKDRSAAMQELRHAWQKHDVKDDPITALMMGISATAGHTTGT